jgi:hypothetical protein
MQWICTADHRYILDTQQLMIVTFAATEWQGDCDFRHKRPKVKT